MGRKDPIQVVEKAPDVIKYMIIPILLFIILVIVCYFIYKRIVKLEGNDTDNDLEKFSEFIEKQEKVNNNLAGGVQMLINRAHVNNVNTQMNMHTEQEDKEQLTKITEETDSNSDKSELEETDDIIIAKKGSINID
jgi:hypothetical protein